MLCIFPKRFLGWWISTFHIFVNKKTCKLKLNSSVITFSVSYRRAYRCKPTLPLKMHWCVYLTKCSLSKQKFNLRFISAIRKVIEKYRMLTLPVLCMTYLIESCTHALITPSSSATNSLSSLLTEYVTRRNLTHTKQRASFFTMYPEVNINANSRYSRDVTYRP